MHLYTGSGTTLYKAEVNANSTVGLEIKKTGSTTQSWRIVDGETVNGALQFYDVTDSRVSMQIDGTGALLVGKTAANFATAGTEINATGRTFMTYAGGGPLQLNRLTSDGDIIELYKDGAEIGNIGTGSGSELAISTPAGTQFISQKVAGDTDGVQYSNSGTYDFGPWLSKDDAVDLGRSNGGWRDLYLKGGIQFDARSNKLDDYEEGTWTPAFIDQAGVSNPVINYDGQTGTYTKIGNICFAHFHLGTDSVSNTFNNVYLAISGLPFTSASDDARGHMSIGFKYSWYSTQPAQGSVFSSNTIVNIWEGNTAGSNLPTNALGTGANQNRLNGTIIYKTA